MMANRLRLLENGELENGELEISRDEHGRVFPVLYPYGTSLSFLGMRRSAKMKALTPTIFVARPFLSGTSVNKPSAGSLPGSGFWRYNPEGNGLT